MKSNSLNFKAGDIVKVRFNIPSGTKTRPTPFEGVTIKIKGENSNKTFTVRKIASAKIAVERIFTLNSPSIEKVDVLRQSKARRAKLYYLRKN